MVLFVFDDFILGVSFLPMGRGVAFGDPTFAIYHVSSLRGKRLTFQSLCRQVPEGVLQGGSGHVNISESTTVAAEGECDCP